MAKDKNKTKKPAHLREVITEPAADPKADPRTDEQIAKQAEGLKQIEQAAMFEQEQTQFNALARFFADSAFPTSWAMQYQSAPQQSYSCATKGLSKREHCAITIAAQMAAVANKSEKGWGASVVDASVILTDLLLEKLNPKQEGSDAGTKK